MHYPQKEEGYHRYFEGNSVARSETISTVGDTISTVVDTQYYEVISSLRWKDTFSTVGGDIIRVLRDTISILRDIQYCGGAPQVLYVTSTVLAASIHSTEHTL